MIKTDITELPFNQRLGMIHTSTPGFLLEIPASVNCQNHIDTVHASVQLALAEASCAECLLQRYPQLRDGFLVLVRKVTAKFKHPLVGTIRGKASIHESHLERSTDFLLRKRGILYFVQAEIYDTQGTLGLQATLEWFIQKQPAGNKVT